jgi:hypothetical protein
VVVGITWDDCTNTVRTKRNDDAAGDVKNDASPTGDDNDDRIVDALASKVNGMARWGVHPRTQEISILLDSGFCHLANTRVLAK